jgi:multidrug efflux pump subunit AcrA (membrane-fusion protein)
MVDQDGVKEPRWATINEIVVRSDVGGVVSEMGLTNGAWADEKSAVLTVVQPEKLRFRASGLQSDLGALRDGLSARIVSPTPTATGRSISLSKSMTGKLLLGLEGDPNDRTIELFVVPDELLDWARPGVSAQLEIVTDASAEPELAIPLAAVQRDGLTPYIFRRTTDNPDEVLRMEADLGRDDGRWVEVLSGVGDGDEIVLDGAFQLMLSTSGSIQKGGHFHADGTFHEGED